MNKALVPTQPNPDPNPRTPRQALPAGACDCHAHVFAPPSQYPYVDNPAYIAPEASIQDYIRMLTAIGCDRAVLVQPSVYGSDNRMMLEVLQSGQFNLRGVVVVEAGISDDELDRLHVAGVRGVRVNSASKNSGLNMADARGLAERIGRLGWHLQFYLRVAEMPGLKETLASMPVPCVIDHFGRLSVSEGIQSENARRLLELAELDNVWFKLMSPCRVSDMAPPYPDVAPFVRELAARAPDRCVWGTDWPHVVLDTMPNDGDLADALAAWLPDETVRRRVLVDNPARLYGF